MLAAGPGWAQAPKTTAANPFKVNNWASLDAEMQSSLIRSPKAPPVLDLGVREDSTFITVFGHKRHQEVPMPGRQDLGAPQFSDAAIPVDLPVTSGAGCSNSAYRTIGGQPATGGDLMGQLGGGRC